MFLSFHMNFSLVTAAVVWAILGSASGLDPSSDTIAARYLKLRTSSRPSNTASGSSSTHSIRLAPYYLLTRREQVTVFRLRTGHNRLNRHLYSKFRIGHTEQSCPIYEPLRKRIWPDHTPVARKLCGSLGEPTMYCHLHRGDWSFHMTNEKKKKKLQEIHETVHIVQEIHEIQIYRRRL